MKKILIFVIIFMIFEFINLMADQSEMTIIDLANSKEIVVIEEVSSEIIDEHIKITNTCSRTELIWEATAEWAICKSVGISDDTYCPFIGWHSNDEAWAYFGETNNIPIWEYNINGAEYLPHDITSNGTYMVGGTENTIYGFAASSGIPDWTYTISNPDDDIFNIVISNDCETIYYISGDDYDYSFITSVDLNTSTENWSYSLPGGGYCAQLVLSDNNEKILISQYYDAIIYSNVGDLLFQTSIGGGSQCTPAISDDGNIFTFGSLSGYGTVYEYNSISQTYDLKWQYQFVGGTYNWVNAIAISGEGSIIAFGTLKSENQLYSGELAVFNIESNEPLWVFQSVYDLISDIDISVDGSIIAASGWGPEDDSDNDFWFFNTSSNEPVFSYNCQGSPIDIDLSNDGSRCIVGGKAVHCRIMGHGGKLYYFDNSPEYGAILGVVTDADTGNPLEDALITVGSYTATSNSNGEYFIEALPGTYQLTCEHDDYQFYTHPDDVIVIVDETTTVDFGMEPLVNSDDNLIPHSTELYGNYPNPFNPSGAGRSPTTTISFSLAKDAENAELVIYNLKGQKVKTLVNDRFDAGTHQVVWNGDDESEKAVSSGIYFYQLKVGKDFPETKRMLLLK